MTDDDRPLTQLAVSAHSAAVHHKNGDVRPTHMLWALCRTEEGRRAVEDRGGDYPAMLRVLAERFRTDAQPTFEYAVYGEDFHRLLAVLSPYVTPDGPTGLDAGVLLDAFIARCHDFPDISSALMHGHLVVEATSEDLPDDAFAGFDPFAGLPLEDDEDGGDGLDMPSFNTPLEQSLEAVRAAAAAQMQDPNVAAAEGALRNLTVEAASQRLDPVVGRAREIADLRAVLERRRKPNALLVGEPGVGKTALVEGLALDLLTLPPNHPLVDRPVLEVQMGALMAGTRFRGDFEARMRHVLDTAVARRAVLFIDEAHALIGVGGGASGGMDAATLLKPVLARGDISLILATTSAELRALSKDRAFSRRFQRVLVQEPTVAETCAIVIRAREGYERHHGVTVPEDTVQFLVEAMETAAPERRFPDKAFDALDACAAAARARGVTTATQIDAEAGVLATTGLRIGRPTQEDVARAAGLEDRIKAAVFGQDAAISAFARAVRLRLLGLQAGNGCASAHLFNGPSGVGKTEAAKALSAALDVPLVRIDMSEFMDAHAVSGLVGAPPGYVGYQEDGLLVAAAEAHPRMVLLLDEVDKAHPRVFDLLLQIMDAGRLTAPDGRVSTFRGTHLIMTANLGASEAAAPAFGFGRTRDPEQVMRDAIAGHFRPEFAERLTTVLNFAPLDRAVAVDLAQRAVAALIDRFARSGVLLQALPSVAEAIVDGLPEGPASGRRIARAVDVRIADAIALAAFEQTGPGPFTVVLEGERAQLQPA